MQIEGQVDDGNEVIVRNYRDDRGIKIAKRGF